jgi:phage-related protein
MDENRRLLFWEGASRKDFKSFPMEVQKDLGVALFVVQLGGTPPSAKPWKGLGSGVWELVEKRLKQLLAEHGLGRRNG